jgi:hypothetical protein
LETSVSEKLAMTGLTSLNDLLRGSAQLKRLRGAADERRRLTERIRALLPANEASHLVAARLSPAGELILVLDSPAWAARLRYAQEHLRTSLEPLKINRVRVRAQPPSG